MFQSRLKLLKYKLYYYLNTQKSMVEFGDIRILEY